MCHSTGWSKGKFSTKITKAVRRSKPAMSRASSSDGTLADKVDIDTVQPRLRHDIFVLSNTVETMSERAHRFIVWIACDWTKMRRLKRTNLLHSSMHRNTKILSHNFPSVKSRIKRSLPDVDKTEIGMILSNLTSQSSTDFNFLSSRLTKQI